ncbi:PREDICTED: cAMP-dependent protein kinase catalytic subunit alpha-like [Papilio xuthus]|uniref:cAMP-dependent protein kinase catalytic subunit n=1 Tax=Papilio xuthus TaxID=66420 RepID=A0A194Q8Q1_PAPXU|nr:PREDICTED: cAMP-dependent protein kinase catalytic subunit alpha-like [Papilio xuthus]KPJ01908.1 cAMP-dependent protein kinase catalytic subunit [Papilio xuthus]
MAKSLFSYQNHVDYLRHLDTLKEDFENKYNEPEKYKGKCDDYDIIKNIGSGAYGEVYLVRNKNTLHYHAMKVVEKAAGVETKTVTNLIAEKQILQAVRFPFIVALDEAFKDNVYLYFIFPLMFGGELFEILQSFGSFSDALAKFYASQVILALEYLHHCNIIHRDIKPENILIASNGYLRVCDFGIAKVCSKKTYSLCGTPEYLAPEVISSKAYSFPVDWWAVGILIYEMLSGYPPFYDSQPAKIYDKILEGHYKCPKTINTDCRNLLKSLLQLNPSKRIGSFKNGAFDIKIHPWFNGVSWNSILQQSVEPPYMPNVSLEKELDELMRTNQNILKKCSKCMFESEFSDF